MISQCCYEPSGRYKPQHFARVWVSSQLYEPLTLRAAPPPIRGRESDDITVHPQGGSKVTFTQEASSLQDYRTPKGAKHHSIFKFEPSYHSISKVLFFFFLVWPLLLILDCWHLLKEMCSCSKQEWQTLVFFHFQKYFLPLHFTLQAHFEPLSLFREQSILPLSKANNL